jgi:enoyl-CoA hydratase
MAFENILVEVRAGIETITFNRPHALNALNSDLLDEFSECLDEIAADESIRVLILTGEGEKSFVAGADIKELANRNPLSSKIFVQKGQTIISKLQHLAVPVIAAVNGFALGGGSEIALACDFIYAAETASFGLPEITLGIIPGFGGTQRLARLIGINKAKELILTGKIISATEALHMGMVNRIVPSEKLMQEVMKTAKNIAEKGKTALRAAKQAVNNGINVDLVTGLNIEADAFALCMTSEDSREGLNAFIEKRKAHFKGSIMGT